MVGYVVRSLLLFFGVVGCRVGVFVGKCGSRGMKFFCFVGGYSCICLYF